MCNLPFLYKFEMNIYVNIYYFNSASQNYFSLMYTILQLDDQIFEPFKELSPIPVQSAEEPICETIVSSFISIAKPFTKL